MTRGFEFNGTVTPPADMMDAARRSLSPTGFSNLMARTSGLAPTPAELVEFADAERQAGIEPPYSHRTEGEVVATLDDVSAEVVGSSRTPAETLETPT
jgi:hypothetical protein